MNTPYSRRDAIRLGAASVATLACASPLLAAEKKRTVVVWAENTAPADKVYPKDVNTAIAEGLKPLKGWDIVVASIDQPDQGLPDDLLNKTDVLMWWGHKRHDQVKDELVDKVVRRVKEQGMGFISIHSSHFAKPNKKLMGTACTWGEYKADGTSVKITVKAPDHPIAKGVKDFDLPKIERYGEPYAVPTPETVVLDGVYTKPDGTTAPGRMGMCWTIGKGRFFYFTPGHETYQDFYMPVVQLIMRNAVEWAAPKA
jgi:trehalose utilization protein